MKQGFSLIELSIGLFLSSLIGTALYNAFFVTNRVVSISDNFITTDVRAALIENQFEKDFAGVIIPDETEIVQTTTSKKASEDKENQAASQEKKEEQPKKKPTEKIFYAENDKDDRLQLLTFITNNPIKVYEKATNTSSKSRVVRVVYRLVADEENQQSFTLMRQESHELDFKAYDPKATKSIRGFELASGIKSIQFEYMYPVKKEAKQEFSNSAQGQTQEKQKPEFKKIKNWNVESKDEKQDQPKIPEFIQCTCEFWDNKHSEESFIFDFQIMTFAAQTAAKKQIRQQVKPAEKKPLENTDGKAVNQDTDKAKPTLPELGSLGK